jgi:hypothetical protein
MSDSAPRWIRQQIAQAGLTQIGEIEPVRTSPTATVMRVNTRHGYLYFKNPIAIFAHEAALTQQLALWFPTNLPAVLAIDRAHGWLLMDDAGQLVKELTIADGDLSRWETLLRQFAALQQGAVAHIPEILALGVQDRRLKILPALYEALLTENPIRFSVVEFAQYTPHLRTLFQRLAEYPIPETLHHDDFHVGNTAIRDSDYVFIDWGESCIAHPFYSLTMVLRYAKFIFDCDDDTLEHLREVYLDCWTAYAPANQLREAFTIAA